VILRKSELEEVAARHGYHVVYWPHKTKEGAYQLQQFYKSIKPTPDEYFDISKESGFNH